jgi:hypothetical protein
MTDFVPLVSKLSGGEAFLIDTGGSKTPAAPVFLSEFGGEQDSQLWELRLTGETDAATPPNPFVFIINKATGMALTVPNTPRFDEAAAVVQFPLDNGDNQKWLQFSPPGQNGNFIFANRRNGEVLSVKGNNLQHGTPIIESQETDNPNQLWATSLG